MWLRMRWSHHLVPWLQHRDWCYQARQYLVRKRIAEFSRNQDPSSSHWIAKAQRTYHACQHLPDYHMTWFHWSTLQFSWISLSRFTQKMGCLFVEFIHCKTMVLSVYINTLSTVAVNARQISRFKRAARRDASNSNIGTVITYIGATLALPRTEASSVIISLGGQVTWTLRKPTALNTPCVLSWKKWSSRCWKGPEK